MRNLTAYVLLCVFLLAFGVPAIAEVNGEVEEQIWICERWLDGELADSCELTVKKNGVLETTFTSKANENQTLHLIAISFPLAKDEEYPILEQDGMWFQGTKYGTGRIIAQQIHENEHWVFTIGDLVVNADTPFTAGKEITYEVNAEIVGTPVGSGSFSVQCGSVLHFGSSFESLLVIFPLGTNEIEINPEWAKHKWVRVPIPPEYGTFFGRAHAVGEVWTVTVGGKEYSAVVEDAETDFDLSLLSCQAPLE